MLSSTHFLDIQLTDCGEVVALIHWPAALYPQEVFWYSLLLEAELTPGPQCVWKDYVSCKNTIDLIRNQARVLPDCSIVSQPTVLLCAPNMCVCVFLRTRRNVSLSVHFSDFCVSLPLLGLLRPVVDITMQNPSIISEVFSHCPSIVVDI
jgi:hypothetical protein